MLGRVFVALTLAIPVALAGQPGWLEYLREHLERHPRCQARDVYKFLHQSVFGPAHTVSSRAEAERYLQEELTKLGAAPSPEPLYEPLADQPWLVRVNLRPLVAGMGDANDLLDAFVATVAKVKGDPRELAVRLRRARALLAELGRQGDADALGCLTAELGAQGFPAVHHSEQYKREYLPAYRVVLAPLLRALQTAK
jgi:hypothetical protein